MTAMGNATDGMKVALTRRRKEEDHAHHQRAGYEERNLHIVDGGPDSLAAIVENFHLDGCGKLRLKLRQHLA